MLQIMALYRKGIRFGAHQLSLLNLKIPLKYPIEAANKILGMGHNTSVPPAMYSQHHQAFGQAVAQHLSKRSQGQIANRRIITLLTLNC